VASPNSIIVTQLSVGKSLKTTLDYFAGTLGGAVYAGAISALIPHASQAATLAVLAIAVAPLTFFAAINPSFSVAPPRRSLWLLAPASASAERIAPQSKTQIASRF
jgi:hypothetical protein